jgi:hypothetical protein
MPTSRLRHRLGAAAAVSLAAALMAAPGIAAAKTRVVDNDGKGTPADCDASKVTFKAIQAAVDASASGDTVKVCPGTYVGKVKISGARNGLQLLSTVAKGATIKAPDAFEPVSIPIVLIDGVANVQVKGFKVRTLAFPAVSDTMDGIVANAATNVTIRGNDVRWSGAAGSRSNLTTGIVAKSGTTGSILANTVYDPTWDGIQAADAATSVTIEGNTIRSVFAGVTGIESASGIEVREGASGLVKLNTISARQVSGTSFTTMDTAIDVYKAGATTVTGNTVTDTTVGIRVRGTGATVNENVFTTRQTAISLGADSDGGEVAANTAKATGTSFGSIWVSADSDGNDIHGNEFRGSPGTDCTDDGGDPLGNIWSGDNHGDESSPAGICDFSAPPA